MVSMVAFESPLRALDISIPVGSKFKLELTGRELWKLWTIRKNVDVYSFLLVTHDTEGVRRR